MDTRNLNSTPRLVTVAAKRGSVHTSFIRAAACFPEGKRGNRLTESAGFISLVILKVSAPEREVSTKTFRRDTARLIRKNETLCRDLTDSLVSRSSYNNRRSRVVTID
jgi:hypothetical protein